LPSPAKWSRHRRMQRAGQQSPVARDWRCPLDKTITVELAVDGMRSAGGAQAPRQWKLRLG